MKLYRYIIGTHHGNSKGSNNISDEDILYQHNITNLTTMIRVARLSLQSRILCKAPKLVTDLCMDMASVNVGWPTAVLDDLRWASGSVKYATRSNASFEDSAAEIKGNRRAFIGYYKVFQAQIC